MGASVGTEEIGFGRHEVRVMRQRHVTINSITSGCCAGRWLGNYHLHGIGETMRYYEMHNNSHYRWLQRSMPLKLQSTGSVEIDANDVRVTIRESILLHSRRHECGAVCSQLGAATVCAREYAAMIKALFGGRQPYSTTDIHLFLEQY